MSKKPKFKPEITRVKLNPEQAVLTCDCFNTGLKLATFSANGTSVCGFSPSKGIYKASNYNTGTATIT